MESVRASNRCVRPREICVSFRSLPKEGRRRGRMSPHDCVAAIRWLLVGHNLRCRIPEEAKSTKREAANPAPKWKPCIVPQLHKTATLPSSVATLVIRYVTQD